MITIRSFALASSMAVALATSLAPAQDAFIATSIPGFDTRYPATLNSASFSYGGRRIGVFVNAYTSGSPFSLVPQARPLTLNIWLSTFDGRGMPDGFSPTLVRISTLTQSWRTGLQGYPYQSPITFDPLRTALIPAFGYFASGGPLVQAGAIVQAEVTVRTPKGTRVVRLPVQVSYPILTYLPIEQPTIPMGG